MIRILFVDDEKSVLDGMRRSMHGMRAEWETSFAVSGAEALVQLSRAPIDVVVTDMRMPGMNGRDLLLEVKRLYPQTVRFVLSGYAEKTSIMEVVGFAHQYLSKPCEAIPLKAAITRSYALRSLLGNEHLVHRIGRIDTLPSLPGTYQRMMACLRGPDPTLAEIGRIIGADIVMTAMIMKLANSAFFGAGKAFKTAERAVSFLGLDTIAGLVLGHGIFYDAAAAGSALDLDALWKHSLATAAAARTVALYEKWESARAEEAFLAGVLHDLGRLILATRPGLGGDEDSTRALQDDHAGAGAYLLGLWGFSDALIEAIAYHHTPSKVSTQEFGLAGLLHVADRLAHSMKSADALQFEEGYLESVDVQARLPAWQAACNAASEEAA